ncbi:MAG: DUF2569 family protein [Gammaproteobacteria bacterium]|nr:DUF2569 family protein [Gammaproteobacteria bacterium]
MNDNLNALPAGSELNHYIIESVLGSGGFGIVYKAHHAHLDEQVVIKEFLPVELAGRHGNTVAPHGTSKQELYSECLRRFMEEGRTLVKLRHPNVVRCRDLFTANGTAYLVMDFEDGLPLDELVRSLEAQGSRYTEQQLLHFLLPLADGLAYIHSQGVLHRDIKPANVFIRRSDGSPVIIDFGAAKQNFALASQSQAPFTEFYAPLEQIEGGGEAKPTVDIHAFGGLMYRLATGQMGPKAEARAMALVYGKPDPLQPAAVLAQGQYSQPFLTTIDQCLAFKANERPQSMQQVRQLLAQPEPRQYANTDKHQFNATSAEALLSALDDLIALAGADSVITDTEMTMLLNKASSLGISKDKAQQYIVQQAVSKGWQLAAAQTAEADKAANSGSSKNDFADIFTDTFGDIFANKGAANTASKEQDASAFARRPQDVYVERYFKTLPAEGSSFTVKTAEKTLTVKVPSGCTAGKRIRLSGHGLALPEQNSRGDLYITLRTLADNIDANAVFVCVEANCPALKDGQLLQHIAIKTEGEVLSPLAAVADNLQSPKSQIFSTAENYQQAISIRLVRGKSLTDANLTELGSFDIENLPVLLKGQPKIDVALVAIEDDLYLKVSDADNKAALRLSQQQAKVAQRANTNEASATALKIGGWLYLVALGVFASPIWLMLHTYGIYSETFSETSWAEMLQNLTELWAISQITSIVVFAMLALLTLYNVHLFIGKKRTFPRTYIWFLALTLIALLADMLIIVPEEFWQEYWPGIINQTIVCLVWIPYMLRSKRVKSTFVN